MGLAWCGPEKARGSRELNWRKEENDLCESVVPRWRVETRHQASSVAGGSAGHCEGPAQDGYSGQALLGLNMRKIFKPVQVVRKGSPNKVERVVEGNLREMLRTRAADEQRRTPSQGNGSWGARRRHY